jgi:hypothetical protein
MLTELIQGAIHDCGKSRYRLSQETGIDQGQLCRFMQGQPGGLSFESVDKVLDALGLEIVVRPRSKRKGE